jgi:hypothetical protein
VKVPEIEQLDAFVAGLVWGADEEVKMPAVRVVSRQRSRLEI